MSVGPTDYHPDKCHYSLWKLIFNKYPSQAKSSCSLMSCDSSGDKSTLYCGGCYSVAYCSKEHQKKDWSKHRLACSPFKMAASKTRGRHLVATRDIKLGEIIMKEQPIAAGPTQYTAPVCLGCNTLAPLDGYRCSKCDWPMCGEECENLEIHRRECEIFKQNKIKPTKLRRRGADDSEILEHPMYECITPLRVCLSMVGAPNNWSVVKNMQTHREERMLEEGSLHTQHNVENFLLQHVNLPDFIPNVSGSEITQACDVLDVNAFEIRGGRRGLYPLTAMMNSSCQPNTQNSIDNKDLTCVVRAIRPIKKGEEICDTYTSTLCNTLYRRKHLKRTKYFECACSRCADPTESGSHFSTLLCRKDNCEGYMISSNPLDISANFSCMKCGFSLSSEVVCSEQESWEEKIESSSKDVATQEALLEELQKIFHPNHNMCMDVKFNLIPLYGRNSNLDNSVTEGKKKEKLCENILEVMEKVIPGLFRIRGMILTELYTTRLFLLRHALDRGDIVKPVFVRKLTGHRNLLTEAKTVLSWEPEGSIEHARLQSVNMFLEQLDQIVEQAGKVKTGS